MQDPPEYFEGRYLAYKPDIPSELLRAATPPDQDHPPQNMTHLAPQFDLVHHQFKQVQRAVCRHVLWLTLVTTVGESELQELLQTCTV